MEYLKVAFQKSKCPPWHLTRAGDNAHSQSPQVVMMARHYAMRSIAPRSCHQPSDLLASLAAPARSKRGFLFAWSDYTLDLPSWQESLSSCRAVTHPPSNRIRGRDIGWRVPVQVVNQKVNRRWLVVNVANAGFGNGHWLFLQSSQVFSFAKSQVDV